MDGERGAATPKAVEHGALFRSIGEQCGCHREVSGPERWAMRVTRTLGSSREISRIPPEGELLGKVTASKPL